MGLHALIPGLAHARALETALRFREKDADFSMVEGLRVPVLATLLSARGDAQAVLAVTATGREVDAVIGSMRAYLPTATVLDFPAWETLPHERLSPSAETVGRRLSALREMGRWAAKREGHLVVVTTVRAALQPVVPGLVDVESIVLTKGGRGYDLAALSLRLAELAYARVDLVTRRGEFAVRGGILDVFPPDAEHPVRADFFGDEIETLKAFSVADQRSLDGELERVDLLPSREMLLTPEVRQRAKEMEREFPSLEGMLAKIAEGIPVEGMESLAPALVGDLVPLTDLLPGDAAVAILSPERVATRALSLAETNREFLDAAWSAATAGAKAPISLDRGDFLTVSQLRAAAAPRTWWTFSPFDSDADEVVRVPGIPIPSFAGQVEGAVDHVAALVRDGWEVTVTAAGTGMVERARDVLAQAGVEPAVEQATIEAGFALPDEKIAVLSEAEFYGRAAAIDQRARGKLASRRKNVVDPLQLKAGDFVVHETHGIGRFVELISREVASGERTARGPLGTTHAKVTREYLVIEYAPSKRGGAPDRLSVPTDQLDLLSRYVGGEAPALSKMGGSDWAAAKGKARKAVRDIAVELVKLYSARMASQGHAFPPDTPWQRELEEAFPFAETPDQLVTIDDVKADMERPIPMDRLISGDVGYGKTEIAVRAAFKAVQDGKQVVMLVPTTLLVRQHMETFAERFAGFPVHLRALSRFQTAKESKETIEGLATGEVDVVIGTHRLLSDGIRFKDLGLVIIDEEQRFGVEHKDALKKLKTNVDILAMSATPIPRTLEMAVTGIREMSTLATPPEDRHPILTFVGPWNEKQVSAAIRRELLREGQVFFVHNRVSSINRVAAQLADLVPEARIAVAHGQLSESVLEQVIVDFWERKFDVLVSTTIIETGIDIANANTLIIDAADKYGLSQLHQIRGRVGRGRERAYAYFLYSDDKPLGEVAQDRLETIAANTELGSGMQVALKDLEIRGAGNLLGGEQSGHIAGVGFDLYLRMIGEAVATFRGDVAEGQTELRLELPVDARIPEEYLESERLRLEAYQKLSTAAAPASPDDAIDSVAEELTDRYGDLPDAVQNLVAISRLRRQAIKAGLSDVVAVGGNLRIAPAELPDSKQLRLKRMYPGAREFAAAKALSIPLPQGTDADLIAWVGGVLTALFGETPQATPPAIAPTVG
ncbi:transcription-repair coupling factor [Pseudolysinimonas sp.]|uniref:transcription-repair coupling factor n=1 Tax=Pseudolysinimonas sp. TaxID=2680009 RepID=UPI0037836E91